jgi:hypothetical protein
MTKLEHVNLTVPDIDEAIRFISIVAPDFSVRRDEKPENSYRWAHIGNDEFYFALQEPHIGANPEYPRMAYKNYGANHIALVVSNLSEIESNLIKSGYRRSIATPKEKHRKRLYFFDRFNFEWELVEYVSDIPSEKFTYE